MKFSDPNAVTQDLHGSGARPEHGASSLHPEWIGRYRIEKALGAGGFGLVFLAHDEQLNRRVAVKVPHSNLVSRAEDAGAYLAEARTVASLDHPNIAPVHDVGATSKFPCYVVSKYVEGTDLATRLGDRRPTYMEAAELVATVAEALHYAHKQGVVHRDVKPGNILIATDGKPYIVDFGLALREESIGKGSRYAGTPAYMSPEQARGEGHRVDGRSDIFSLGVVLYELLVGCRPFRGDSQAEVLEHVTSHEPRPLRQYDEKIPTELERICHKAMAKHATERYSSAHDLAEDLRQFVVEQKLLASTAAQSTTSTASHTTTSTTTLASATSTASATDSIDASTDQRRIKIVPKGLRSFDAHDADFFLALLPGPRDRDGLPDSLRFWKTRIEETDPDQTFPVGLIYGPSGCGKSSLIKAGLLPRLSDNVISIYVEATPDETEKGLLHALQKRCSGVPVDLNLKQTLAALRQGAGLAADQKVLIVLDQFEQWLHARSEDEEADLVQALRQCDGGRVQCLVMVRDDFWMAATRFMRALEIRLVEAQNSAPVDLFPVRHAEKVLAAFGRAFGALTDDGGKLTSDHKSFLRQAVAGLAVEGKVNTVRLALFAEMMKDKIWSPVTLKGAGGATGIGVTFLEETFSASTAPPGHRYHQQAVRSVLESLLPDSGTDIKGHMRSHAELLTASGYANRPEDFDELLKILDSETRLITPTDLEGLLPDEGSDARTNAASKYYQLAHDYLVHALREWLTRKQKETRRGRAELRLAERATLWNSKPENRHLPSWWETLSIRLFTDKKRWSETQRMMMAKGVSHHLMRLAVVFAVMASLWWVGYEVWGRQRAASLVAELSASEISTVPERIDSLADSWHWALPLLEQVADSTGETPEAVKKRLHAQIALVEFQPQRAPTLFEYLLHASPQTLEVIRERLTPYGESLVESGWAAVNNSADDQPRLNAACALARFVPDDHRWHEVRFAVAAMLVQELSRNVSDYQLWVRMLEPIRIPLAQPLSNLARDERLSELQRETAVRLLLHYGHDQVETLCDVLMDSDPVRFEQLLTLIKPKAGAACDTLKTELARSIEEIDVADQQAKVYLGKRQANAAIALMRLGDSDAVWSLFTHSTDPRAGSWFIDRAADYAIDPSILVQKIDSEVKSKGEVLIQMSVLHSLGQFDSDQRSHIDTEQVIANLLDIYRGHPDTGIHSSVAWLLRQWEQAEKLSRIDQELSETAMEFQGREVDDRREWYVNSQGQTMAILQAGQFRMGSPPGSDPDADVDESAHLRGIERTFAISTTETTWAQFNRYLPQAGKKVIRGRRREDAAAATGRSWYDAAGYCNWLSAQEGLPSEEYCYEPNEDGEYDVGMTIKRDFLELRGYRLPTEAEWEFACRAGTVSRRYFGFEDSLLGAYCRYRDNSDDHTWIVGTKKPNAFGLFDMYGNVREWCQDRYVAYPPESAEPHQQRVTVGAVDAGIRVLRGGGFSDYGPDIRTTNRDRDSPNVRYGINGFRVARTHPL